MVRATYAKRHSSCCGASSTTYKPFGPTGYPHHNLPPLNRKKLTVRQQEHPAVQEPRAQYHQISYPSPFQPTHSYRHRFRSGARLISLPFFSFFFTAKAVSIVPVITVSSEAVTAIRQNTSPESSISPLRRSRVFSSYDGTTPCYAGTWFPPHYTLQW
jgi:hypothetical protein